MFEQPQVPNNAEIDTQKKSETVFNFEHITITPEHPYIFSAHVKKLPIEIKSGDKIGGNGIEVKIEGAIESVMKESEMLKELPEVERLSALLKLVREKLIYPYPEIIEEAKKKDSELAEWLEKRFGSNTRVTGSEINEFLNNGYGDCKVMAVLYLLGAQSAGLKGIYAQNWFPIKNLERPDTKQPIFKSVEVDRDMGSHAWAEIQLENGTWVPVDISANMIGTEEMLQFFKEAGYSTTIPFNDEGVPSELTLNKGVNLFQSGESEKDIELTLRVRNDFMTRKPVAPEFSGNVQLKFSSSSEDYKSIGVELQTE